MWLYEALPIMIAECGIRLCDFHREKAWKEWCAKQSHGLGDNEKAVRRMLTAIARADTEEKVVAALAEINDSHAYKSNPQLQQYLCATWLPEIKVS